MQSIIQSSVFVVTLVLLIVSCTTNTSSVVEPLEQKDKKLTGIYTISTTGNDWKCETVKHYFEISVYKKDSSFLYHAFCQPHNFDPTGIETTLRPRSVIGKWTYGQDSLIRLKAYNGEIVKLRVNADKTVDAFKDNDERLYTDIYFDSTRIYH